MELAVEDVNAYAAGRGVTFRADVRDTKLDPATALAAVQSLRTDGVQVVIGPQSSAELAAMKPYVDANPLLVVSQSSTAGTLAVNDRIFRFTPADSLEGVAITALMWADGIRAVVPIWRADAGNQGLHTATAARMAALGGTAWGGVEYAATGANYAAAVSVIGTQVRQALAIHPAAQVGVYLAGFDEVADVFALAAADPVLASVRWYGADGIAQSPALLAKPAAVVRGDGRLPGARLRPRPLRGGEVAAGRGAHPGARGCGARRVRAGRVRCGVGGGAGVPGRACRAR